MHVWCVWLNHSFIHSFIRVMPCIECLRLCYHTVKTRSHLNWAWIGIGSSRTDVQTDKQKYRSYSSYVALSSNNRYNTEIKAAGYSVIWTSTALHKLVKSWVYRGLNWRVTFNVLFDSSTVRGVITMKQKHIKITFAKLAFYATRQGSSYGQSKCCWP